LDCDYFMRRRDSFGTIPILFKKTLNNGEFFGLYCGIFISAGVKKQNRGENAANIKADIVVEAANGPTTIEGTKVLTEQGKLLVPDVLASSGGVTVSYFEWVQNNQGYYWIEEEVEDKLYEVMTQSIETIYNT